MRAIVVLIIWLNLSSNCLGANYQYLFHLENYCAKNGYQECKAPIVWYLMELSDVTENVRFIKVFDPSSVFKDEFNLHCCKEPGDVNDLSDHIKRKQTEVILRDDTCYTTGYFVKIDITESCTCVTDYRVFPESNNGEMVLFLKSISRVTKVSTKEELWLKSMFNNFVKLIER